MSVQGPSNYLDFAGLASLGGRADSGDPEVLREVARQFEALFANMMLKSMRAASLGDGIFDSEDSESYRDMFDRQISVELARGKGLGISEMLVRQLSGTLKRQDPDLTSEAGHGTNRGKPAPDVAPASPPAADKDQVRTDDFVGAVWPHARRAARELGVDPRAIVAQAALETGWGQHTIMTNDGREANNLFGIKANDRWQGARVSHATTEFVGQAPRKWRADFRSYDSLEEGFNDYVRFLKDNPRYRDALAAGTDGSRFAEGLQEAGYATDPQYASKIRQIMDGQRLVGAIAALKNERSAPITEASGGEGRGSTSIHATTPVEA